MTKARRKPKPPARTKRKIGAGKVAAAMLTLAPPPAPPAAGPRAKKPTAPSPTTAPPGAAGPIAFIPGCKLPFDPIKSTGLPIDAQCTVDGNGGKDTAKVLENHAKNNFCVTGTPVVITYDD